MRDRSASTVFQIIKAIFSFLRHGWQVRFSNPSNAVFKVLRLGEHGNPHPLNSSLKLEASHQQYYFSSGGPCSIKKLFATEAKPRSRWSGVPAAARGYLFYEYYPCL